MNTLTHAPVHGGFPGTVPAPSPLPIDLMTDDQINDEADEAEANYCCETPWAAAKRFCGCGGVAADYLDRLRSELDRRRHA